MSGPIELWQLPPSYNSRKVRLALGIKGVAYTSHAVKDGENDKVIAVSGQPMTPVLRHGDVVIFDSGAIVRYIDANIPGPRLFSADLDEMRAIENWETRARAELLPAYNRIASQVRTATPDAAIVEEGKNAYLTGARNVQQALNEHGVLVGQALSAADVFAGCYLAYAYLTPAQAKGRKPMEWALANLSLADKPEFARLTAWYERLRPYEGT